MGKKAFRNAAVAAIALFALASLPRGTARDEIRRLLSADRYPEARVLAAELVARPSRAGADVLTPETAEDIELYLEAASLASCPVDVGLVELAGRVVRFREGRGEPLALARAVRLMADVHSALGEADTAARVRERALELLESHLGKEHPRLAEELLRLARDLGGAGRQAEAVIHGKRALEIQEAAFGSDSVEVASTSSQLAWFRARTDPEATEYARRAVTLLERAPQARPSELAFALTTYGRMLESRGDYVEARRLHERARSIYESAFGPADPRMSRVLLHLGLVEQVEGDYAEARRLYEQALQIRRTCLGEEHPSSTVLMHNLGTLCLESGNYTRARELLERTLAIRRKTKGNEHPWVAQTLNNLGLVLFAQGELPAARRALEETLSIRERAGDRFAVAQTLANLAEVLVAQRDFSGARARFERAFDLQVEVVGPTHRDPAITRAGLGWLCLEAGEYEDAVRFLDDALRTLKKTVGFEDSRVPIAAMRLALALRRLGRDPQAFEAALEAESLARETFRKTTRVFSEREALESASARNSGLDVALSVVTDPAGGSLTDRPRRAFDEVVRSRALVLDEMATRQSGYLRGGGAEVTRLAADLRRAHERVAKLSVAALDQAGSADATSEVRRALEAAEIAEQRLAERSSEYRKRSRRFQVGLAEVTAALPPNAALVSYVSYTRRERASRGSSDSPAYAAFVLGAGEGAVRVVPLALAAEIDEAVNEWRSAVSVAPIALPAAAREGEARCRAAGERLRRLVWDPVMPFLAGKDMVLVVPDGSLHGVSLETLPEEGDRYLAEAGPEIHYLSAERDLAIPKAAAGSGFLALGDPDFDGSPEIPGALRGGDDRIGGSSCPDLRNRSFTRLPQSRSEVDEIAALWNRHPGWGPAAVLTGRAAGEREFKTRSQGRRFIHLATHAFFAPATCASILSPSESQPPGSPPLESPLLHSGLVLAGANLHDSRLPGGEDGIVTAQEIASLDLSGAEWVVLSGCETGRGEVHRGEGVLGLRRAFELAGVGTLIMSLWEVRDDAAREWMRELYAGRLSGLGTPASVRRAHRRVLEARRRSGRSTHPYYWGPFIAVGEWRPVAERSRRESP